MFKYVICFALLVALAVAKPYVYSPLGAYTSPVAAAYTAPVAYPAYGAYSAYSAYSPLAYSAYSSGWPYYY